MFILFIVVLLCVAAVAVSPKFGQQVRIWREEISAELFVEIELPCVKNYAGTGSSVD